MSRRAWTYIVAVLLTGISLGALGAIYQSPRGPDWPTFATLVVLTTLAQLFRVETPNHKLYYVSLSLFVAGVVLLPSSLFVFLVLISHSLEWAKERWMGSQYLRAWYLQPFNVATHIVAGFATRLAYVGLSGGETHSGVLAPGVLCAIVVALVYVAVNHTLVATALVLARGLSWRESGVADVTSLLTDLILSLLGYVIAVLWELDPWLILPALSPLVLVSRALRVPLLEKEASTDHKTDLYNARYFTSRFITEFERAQRFQRPLAVIMADIDLLRDINNTFGHLAGDAVLQGVAQAIREDIREYDIAARFGGEEFCIVLPEVGPAGARDFAERLRRRIESSTIKSTADHVAVQVTISLGVASYPFNGNTPTDLIHAADVALYRAKLRGRNCVVSASETPRTVKRASCTAASLSTTPDAASTAAATTSASTSCGLDSRAATDYVLSRLGKSAEWERSRTKGHANARLELITHYSDLRSQDLVVKHRSEKRTPPSIANLC